MGHELICNWLSLPADAWPPDHYRLLGLEPGEPDVGQIEQRVHQRLETVRRYQMVHPEQATEAMNRLAQAYVCLTDAAAKKAYDQGLFGPRTRPAPPPPPPPPVRPPTPRDPLVWLYTPGAAGPGEGKPPPSPVRVPPPPLPARVTPPPPLPEADVLPEVEVTPEPPPKPAPPPEPVDPVLQSASSAPVRRGLATRRALYRRVVRTRRLLRLWHKMRKHLEDPEKRLSKQEATELAKVVEQTEDAIDDFPLLGEAGQPGYLIVSLTTLDRVRDLRNLTVSQRESLERDWRAGLRWLQGHRDFLREQLKEERGRGRTERVMRFGRSLLNEQPIFAAVLLMALAAVGVALWRSFLKS